MRILFSKIAFQHEFYVIISENVKDLLFLADKEEKHSFKLLVLQTIDFVKDNFRLVALIFPFSSHKNQPFLNVRKERFGLNL